MRALMLLDGWPLLPTMIGGGILTIGTALAAKQALIQTGIGTSNVPMVIALLGATVFALGSVANSITYLEDGAARSISFTITVTATLAALNYGAVHMGITHGLPGIGITESVTLQAGLSFIGGFAIGAGVLMAFRQRFGQTSMFGTIMKGSGIIGLLCLGSALGGPSVTYLMGEAATNAAETIALEAITAAGIASFAAIVIAHVAKSAKRFDPIDDDSVWPYAAPLP
ncbi:MAG: hypothetical protein JSS50_03745 [Proteobacteria bacterium]|nr:hypothetical protein [Pseudomonadota bacterium]